MKKRIGALLICVLLFAGCSLIPAQTGEKDEKKQSKIEVYSAAEEKLLKTIDNQDTVSELLNTARWEAAGQLSDELKPEYKLLVYQEKTLLLGQDPDKERGYELIETITTYQNSSQIEEVISDNVIKGGRIPEDAMTFYYSLPDDTLTKLQELLSQAV